MFIHFGGGVKADEAPGAGAWRRVGTSAAQRGDCGGAGCSMRSRTPCPLKGGHSDEPSTEDVVSGLDGHHLHLVSIASRSKRTTLNTARRIHTPSRPSPKKPIVVADSHSAPVNCATNTAVSGMMISTPNCCAVRASLTREEITIAACKDTSAAAGPTSAMR